MTTPIPWMGTHSTHSLVLPVERIPSSCSASLTALARRLRGTRMALADEIRDLAQSSLATLDAIHDYYVHARHAWQLVAKLVAKGRRFTIHNMATGTMTDQDALVKLAQIPKRYYQDSW